MRVSVIVDVSWRPFSHRRIFLPIWLARPNNLTPAMTILLAFERCSIRTSQPGHRPYCLRVSWFSPVPPCKYRECHRLHHGRFLPLPVRDSLFQPFDAFLNRLFNDGDRLISRSLWPRGLGHELSSPAWTLGSWVRIPLESWMSVCAFILCCHVCW
jgi:hypothetical protein